MLFELNIFQLLAENQYIIPLYQRNYTWGKIEITQLLQDIWDKCIENSHQNYYIGTIVVDVRKDGKYEIIDGQQRHTTLSLIHAAFQMNHLTVLEAKYVAIPANLHYDARPHIQQFISTGCRSTDLASELDAHALPSEITAAYNDFIPNFLNEKQQSLPDDFAKYVHYFYKQVKMIRVQVPIATDINHYFEIMNTRGEQLEKHEILKAAFVADKSLTDAQRILFAEMWDACAQIDKPIQSCFVPVRRANFFGNNYDQMLNIDWDNASQQTNSEINQSLEAILAQQGVSTNSNEQTNHSEPFKSTIDFPNFLLHVYRLHTEKENASLDDKNLLKTFGYQAQSLPPARAFMDTLFRYRTLFDKYVIKYVKDKDTWSLKKPSLTDKDLAYVNTFKKHQESIVMCQAMLHVSNPSNTYKDWLYLYLKSLDKDIQGIQVLANLEQIAINKCQVANIQLNDSYRAIPHIVFNFLDYELWKRYKSPMALDLDTRIQKNKDNFFKFRFTQNNSVEHLHPQASKEELEEDKEGVFSDKDSILNYFGNLCLISRERNSKYNDFNFHAKKQYFNKYSSIESLKQVIMFSYDNWNTDQIKQHGSEMKDFLVKALHIRD